MGRRILFHAFSLPMALSGISRTSSELRDTIYTEKQVYYYSSHRKMIIITKSLLKSTHSNASTMVFIILCALSI